MGEIRYYADMTSEEVAEVEARQAAQEARRAKAGKPPGCATCELSRFGSAGACMACGELWPDLVEAHEEIDQLEAKLARVEKLAAEWSADKSDLFKGLGQRLRAELEGE